MLDDEKDSGKLSFGTTPYLLIKLEKPVKKPPSNIPSLSKEDTYLSYKSFPSFLYDISLSNNILNLSNLS